MPDASASTHERPPLTGLVGWYDSPLQAKDKPTYNPPFEGPCVVCYQPMTLDTVRTVSVMDVDGDKSFFYRLHRTCDDELTDEEKASYDQSALAMGRKSS